MSEILSSVLADGGWALVAGWLLPTAINVLLFTVLVIPSFQHVPAFHAFAAASDPVRGVVILVVAVVGGLLLSALQTPLYRILEGYLGWPHSLQEKRRMHHLAHKEMLEKRMKLARLSRRTTRTDAQETELATLRNDPLLAGVAERGRVLSAWQNALLGERLERYPIDDEQVVPTRLGNAIRRFEVYGYDRYRLDAIVLWYALTGVVPDRIRKQESASRATVDFFVCLFYGQLFLAVSGLGAIAADPKSFVRPVVAIVLVVALAPAWYQCAITGTDEWAAAVQAMVDVGRKPLAKSLGLKMPASLEEERKMWRLVTQQALRAYRDSNSEIDQYRRRRRLPQPPGSAD